MSKNEKWSNWINPGFISHQKFDYKRFSYHGKLVHLNAAICHYINRDVEKITYSEHYQNLSPIEKKIELNKKFKRSDLYQTLSTYLNQWALWKYNKKPIAIESVLYTKNNKLNTKKITFLPIIE